MLVANTGCLGRDGGRMLTLQTAAQWKAFTVRKLDHKKKVQLHPKLAQTDSTLSHSCPHLKLIPRSLFGSESIPQ